MRHFTTFSIALFLQKMGTDSVSPNDKIENSCQLLDIFSCFAMID